MIICHILHNIVQFKYEFKRVLKKWVILQVNISSKENFAKKKPYSTFGIKFDDV